MIRSKEILIIIITFYVTLNLPAANQLVIINGDSGAGSLREAILDAGDGDEIDFNLSTGNETIIVGSELAISKGLTINGENNTGSGTAVTIQVTTPGTSTFRVFNINAESKTINLNNLTINGGDISGNGDDPSAYGGSVAIFAGTLNLTSCIISGSKSNCGGGVFSDLSTLNISSSTIKSNSADMWGGGGVFFWESIGTIINSTINANQSLATSNGGGGIFSNMSELDIISSTICDNQDLSFGGGGIMGFVKDVTITSSTISGNSTAGQGGGYWMGGETSESFTLNVKNTIIAGNANNDDFFYGDGDLTDSGYNIIGYTNVAANATGGFNNPNTILYNTVYNNGTTSHTFWNMNGTDLAIQNLNLSSTLAANSTTNGTKTLAINSGSFAISAGVWDAGLTSDQRGFGKNNPPTIGAYEFDGDDPLPITLSAFWGTMNDTPNLHWITQSESNNLGFYLFRSENENGFEEDDILQINADIISGAGTTFLPTTYSFCDEYMVLEGHQYYYWLQSVSFANEFELFGPIYIEVPYDGYVITEVSVFSVIYENSYPEISWITECETDNLGFFIKRSEDPNGYVLDDLIQLNPIIIPGMGTTFYDTEYSFRDENIVIDGRTYWYWLVSINSECEINVFGPVALDIPDQGGLPNTGFESSMNQNYPNPFNPQTTIYFSIEEGETGVFTIFNIRGQEILKDQYETGEHIIEWNAEGLSSGIYFYRLISPSTDVTKKMILMK